MDEFPTAASFLDACPTPEASSLASSPNACTRAASSAILPAAALPVVGLDFGEAENEWLRESTSTMGIRPPRWE
jgi:hypothetical protein